MMENTSSLVTREEGFIEISHKYPRAINGVVDIHKVSPKVGAKGMVRASINTGADGACTTTADREGYRVGV